MKKIYISVPILGNPDAKKQAEKAFLYLSNKGYNPISPLDLALDLDEFCRLQDLLKPSEIEYLLYDLNNILAYDGIYLCRNYQESQGCMIELQFCKYLKRSNPDFIILFERKIIKIPERIHGI